MAIASETSAFDRGVVPLLQMVLPDRAQLMIDY